MDQTFAESPLALATRVAARFNIATPLEVFDFAAKGNINQHTFLVHAGRGEPREYLLQRINHQVFVRPHSVMAAMMAALAAQEACRLRGVTDPEWEAITLLPLRSGEPYLELQSRRGPTVWRLMKLIPDALTYKSLGEIADPAERGRVAGEAGRGLALFGNYTASVDTSRLSSPLPGFHDTRVYYNQLLSVLAGHRTLEEAGAFLPTDPIVRESTQQHFLVHLSDREYRRRMDDLELQPAIALARDNAEFALTLVNAMASGRIRTVAVHGDTKLDNFLFSTHTGRVKAMVDLDTIMPLTWLVDWGDMVRSLVNVAGEKERDLARVQVERDVYEALARGFLAGAGAATPDEIALMPEAVEIIALELGVRFLADYLRGDSYFVLGPTDPRDLNKVRALVQLTLFERLRAFRPQARECLARDGEAPCAS
ncbi:MAG: phosphotransferase [Armatimonadetes bacterium]|nr:phosphotransferase [Armatimonadota bacterium]